MATIETYFTGIGLGSSLADAVRYCDWKLKGQPQWAQLGYLVLGLAARDRVPRDLAARLRDAGFQHSVHLSALNLMEPLERQRPLLDHLLRRIDEIQPAYIEEDLGLWTWGKLELMNHMLHPILDEPTLEVAVDLIREVIRLSGRPFLAENPPVYFDCGELDMLHFMLELSRESGCGLVLDIGHIVGYCIATGRDPEAYLKSWEGFDRVREIHVAGFDLLPDVAGPMWFDNHGARISDYELDLIGQVQSQTRHALPVTLEQETADYRLVAEHIARVSRRFFNDH